MSRRPAEQLRRTRTRAWPPWRRASPGSSRSETHRHAEPRIDGLSGGEGLPEQGERDRPPVADGAFEPPAEPAARVDADVEPPAVETGAGRRHDDVTGERHVDPGTHRGAVDRRDGGQPRLGDAHETGVRLEERPALGGDEVGEVAAGTEHRRRRGDDRRADVRLLVELVERINQRHRHARAERVAVRGVVEGDDRDPVEDGRRDRRRAGVATCGLGFRHGSYCMRKRCENERERESRRGARRVVAPRLAAWRPTSPRSARPCRCSCAARWPAVTPTVTATHRPDRLGRGVRADGAAPGRRRRGCSA